MSNNNQLLESLPHEDDVEQEAQSHTGIMRNFRIAKCERKRFFLFGAMFFIIGFIYSFMRILKDAYVMGRQDPNCILYIKMFYILPASFIVIFGINYFLGARTISKIFTVFSILFMTFFFIFGFWVLFEELLEKKAGFDREQYKDLLENSNLNSFFKYFLLTLLEPMATLVYIVAELWGSLMLSYLFLSFLNESCTKRQHDRFIPPLLIITNISLFLSATVTTGFLKLKENISNSSLIILMSFIFFLIGFLVLVLLIIKYHLEMNVIKIPIFIPAKVESKKKKDNVGFLESLKIMKKSRFLLAMCSVVFLYNILYNLLESVYKNGVKESAIELKLEKDTHSVHLTNIDQYITSIAVITLNLTSFSHLVDLKSWYFVAVISPFVALISVLLILGLGIYNSGADGKSFEWINVLLKGFPVFYLFENYCGMICLSAMKVFKYAAFDVTKERISMKVESRYRPKFKSIYDGIFNKIGKSGGSLYGIFIGSVFSDLNVRGMSPMTAVISSFGIVIWFSSIGYLGDAYDYSNKIHENIDIDLREEDIENYNQKNIDKIEVEDEKVVNSDIK